MKRLLRWAFNGAAAVSAVLFVATCVLWVRSYYRADYICYQRVLGWSPYAISFRGAIQWKVADYSYPLPSEGWQCFSESGPSFYNITEDMGRGIHRWEQPDHSFDPGVVNFRACGFEGGHGAFYNSGPELFPEKGYSFRYLTTPLWALAMLSGVFTAVRAISAVNRHRRNTRGHCPICGYDLRATPDRCPECGMVPKHPAAPPRISERSQSGPARR